MKNQRFIVAALVGVIGGGAFVLRSVHLDALPPGLFCDEAALGYNAYSIAETGRDVNGNFLPLYVWSFDVSYKNPVFIYSAVPLIELFGLSETTVRLTAATYGTATVVAIFFLGRLVLGSTGGLLAALFLALCPWHLHFSRIAFELITFPLFFLLAATALAAWSRGRRCLPAAALLAGASMYTYAVAKFFVPLYLLGFCVSERHRLWRKRSEALAATAALLISVAPLLYFDLTHRDRAGSYFQANTWLGEEPSLLAHFLRFARNYESFFSPRFLLEEGDPLFRHAVQGHGELLPLVFWLALIGALACARGPRPQRLLLWWAAAYPIAPALMTEIPSASRGIIGAPVLVLLAAGGALAVLERAHALLPHRPRTGPALAALLLLAGNAELAREALQYGRMYRDEYPRYAAKYFTGFQFGHREVVRFFREHAAEYDRMGITAALNNQPRSLLYFYSRFPPAWRQEGGLTALEQYSGMGVWDPADPAWTPDEGRVLLAVRRFELDLFREHTLRQTVVAPDGSAAFVIVENPRMHRYVSHWRILSPFAPHEQIEPPAVADPSDESFLGRAWQWYDWQRLSVDLYDVFYPDTEGRCAWAINFVESDRPRTLRAFASFEGEGEIWVSEERLRLRRVRSASTAFRPDRLTGVAHLESGRSMVAIRSCASEWDWRFYFRFTEIDATPVEGLSWVYGG